jgi:hypothetical protein
MNNSRALRTLALAGWDPMLPPLDPGNLKTDQIQQHAPLIKWTVQGHFGSFDDCRSEQGGLLKLAAAKADSTVRNTPDQVNALRLAVSECVEGDDPRLKQQ